MWSPLARAALVAVGLSAGCGDADVFVSQPWPSSHTAVVIVTDAAGEPIQPLAIVPPGASATRWSLPRIDAQIFVRTWGPEVAAEDGQPLIDCGLRLGGNVGQPAPPATTSWTTDVFQVGDADGVSLQPETPPLRGFELRLSGCEAAVTCDGYTARSLPVPSSFRPEVVVHLGDHALVAGYPPDDTDRVRIARVDPSGFTVFPEDPRVEPGIVMGFGWRPSGTPDRPGRVWLTYRDGRAILLDRDGGFVGKERIPGHRRIDIGLDGSMLLASETAVYQIPADAIEANDITATLPAALVLTEIDEMFVYQGDWQMLRAGGDVLEWTGSGWRLAFIAELSDAIARVGADPGYQALVGEFELVRLRSPSGSWPRVERPFDRGRRLNDVEGLLGGRFVVVGERGSAAVYDGDGWCRLEHDGPMSNLRSVATSTLGADGYAIGSNEDSEPPIALYVDVPDR